MASRQYRGLYVHQRVFKQVSITIPSVASGAATSVTVNLGTLGLCKTSNDVQLGDIIDVSPQTAAVPAGLVLSAHAAVSGNNTIVVNVYNGTGGTYNPGAQNFTVVVQRPKTDIL